jgi:hypothetical protein
MDKTLKRAWLKALRSGEYKQGLSWLHHDGHYCCLGVLCDVAEKLGAFAVIRRDNGTILGCSNLAQPGLNEALSDAKQSKVASMNDHCKPFHEIADWISKNVKASAGRSRTER